MDEEGSGMVKPKPSQQSFKDRCDAEDDENFDQQKEKAQREWSDNWQEQLAEQPSDHEPLDEESPTVKRQPPTCLFKQNASHQFLLRLCKVKWQLAKVREQG